MHNFSDGEKVEKDLNKEVVEEVENVVEKAEVEKADDKEETEIVVGRLGTVPVRIAEIGLNRNEKTKTGIETGFLVSVLESKLEPEPEPEEADSGSKV